MVLQVDNPTLHISDGLAVLLVGGVEGGVAVGVECWGALGLHGRGEAVLEDGLALGLVHRGAVLGEGGNYTQLDCCNVTPGFCSQFKTKIFFSLQTSGLQSYIFISYMVLVLICEIEILFIFSTLFDHTDMIIFCDTSC